MVAAIASATRCIDVCDKHAAPPFEQFLGHAVLALAQRAAGKTNSFASSRAQAIALFTQLPDDEKQWAQSTLRELGD